MRQALILILTILSNMSQALILILTKIGRFKRALTLVFIVAVCLIGFMAVRGVMPFMPVFGTSMEPELHAGNLIVIEEKAAADVKVGDIIVYNVPSAIRDYYNYPPVVAHRVIEVRDTEFGIAWRTKGDNAGEDPFTVRANDLRGTVSQQIPFLGFPFLFLQSQQGLMFVIIALSLLALYLYANDLSRGGQKVHRGIFAPVIEESQRGSQTLVQRMDSTEKVMEHTQQALSSFATAIAEYAEHLKSHTSAIQGLSEASQELRKGAAEQNKVLERLAATMEQKMPLREEVTPTAEPVVPEAEKVKFPPGCVRSRQQPIARQDIFGAG
ncbi:MAG: signal peptidase I [Dehalococcoidia bacterium]|nr:MAG: signal peptidase I [Dehalococcoidia bacterium]